jgi:hypothetical protein
MRSLLHAFGAQIGPEFEEVATVVLHVALVLLLAWAGWRSCSRLMRLDYDGNVGFIPNGLITAVTNLRREYTYVVIDAGIAYGAERRS